LAGNNFGGLRPQGVHQGAVCDLSRKHLEAAPFGAITLDRLRPSDIEALVLALRGKGLSDSTVRQVYTVSRLAFDGAVRDALLGRNPVALVARPGVARTEARHLGADDMAAVLRPHGARGITRCWC
jgi:site-specific recombinase XerC